MVAHSFNRQFVEPIVNGLKRQTIRAPRRRHARIGEALQLYTGMRTRACRLIRDDVICTRLGEVTFDLRLLANSPEPKDRSELECAVAEAQPALTVNGIPLQPDEKDAFAASDGFAFWSLAGRTISPFEAMVLFWMGKHGASLFEGVLIEWEPRL